MGRKRRQQPNFWESPDKGAMHFGRIYPELVKHKDFIALSLSARLLYLEMLEAAAGKRDGWTFTVAHFKARGWTSPTFHKARNELIKAGFIAITYNGRTTRKPSKYSFVKNWNQGQL